MLTNHPPSDVTSIGKVWRSDSSVRPVSSSGNAPNTRSRAAAGVMRMMPRR
ncbi:hypothetical protein D3C78_1784200 [compost metagenome]